jgi:dolichol kinase
MDKGLFRQIIHIIIGTFCIIAYALGVFKWWVFFGFIIFFLLALFMLHISRKTTILHKIITEYEREDVFLPGWGPLNLMKGFLLASLLFPKNIALPALIILVYGDAFATIIGVKGKYSLPWNAKKTWEGTLAGSIISSALLLFLLAPIVAVLAAIIGMFVETIKRPIWLDDNMIIPLVTGMFLLLVL